MTTHLIQAALDGATFILERHPDFPTAVVLRLSFNDQAVTRTVDQFSILRDRPDLLDGTVALMRNELAAKLGNILECPHCGQSCEPDLCYSCGLDPRRQPSADYPPVRPVGCTWSFNGSRWTRESGPEAYLLEE